MALVAGGALMELVNRTPLPAELVVSKLGERPLRAGLLFAKATFLLARGEATLDDQDPMPLLAADAPHPLGLLPADVALRPPGLFEVMLLGEARPAGGRPARQMRVSLSVGDARRELEVFGDRVWEGERPSEPEPFERMPLTWSRAFGGTAEIEVDEDSWVTVSDPRNPKGRGFDALALARALGEALRPPAGYPRLPEGPRPLPNLEDPRALIASPGDAPMPACWAPLPPGGAQALRATEAAARGDLEAVQARAAAWALERASPAWSVAPPEAGAPVRISGCTPDGPLAFAMPKLRVFADYVVGARRGSRELSPVRLLILPEELRVSVLYEARFQVEYEPGLERGMRLRVEGR